MTKTELHIEYVPVDDLKPYDKNARKHGDFDVDAIAESIRKFGFNDPIGVWGKDNLIVEGHGRLLASKKLGMKKVPIIHLDHLSDEQRRAYALAHNKTAENSEWDMEMMQEELRTLSEEGFDTTWLGFDDLMKEADYKLQEEESRGALLRDFIISPFTVLDTRQGSWQERKRYWNNIIQDNDPRIRGEAKTFSSDLARMKGVRDVSLLDATLAELMIKWFCPEGGSTFDTFAGDTVFGFVSGYLGHKFTGIELRKEQADYNNKRFQEGHVPAIAICDDGRNIKKHIGMESQDMFFSCPPYFDLEVYSDNPNDASNQKTYKDFYAILDEAFANAIDCLKPDRFAVVVVGDMRDKKTGGYYDFVHDVVNTFVEHDCIYYNHAILVNACTTGAIRARNAMRQRKLVKVHQDVLVFYKGDQRNIKNNFPVIEMPKELLENESEDQ